MIMEQDQALSKMSLEMNSCFDASGFSEYARKFGYSAKAQREIIFNTANDNTYIKVLGSRAESTDLLFSDIDIIMIDQCSTVGYNPQEAAYSNKVYLRLTSGPSTRAGYTKLQIYLNGKPNKIDYNKLFHHYGNHFVKINKGKSFLSNRSDFSLSLPLNNKPLYIENHGPAATSTFAKQTLDHVPAYESQILPKEVMPWFKRNRHYNWPTKETCDLFKSMGCCYVGVGHSKSQEQHLEWRISLTKQELYLMLNLNPTQYRCYIALKVIKTEFVQTECENMLSSYHCKTALFYTIENTDPDIWQPHNLIQCVLNCLKLLLDWVKKRNCPNYFIPEENMFETKLIDNYKIQKLQVILGMFIYPPGSLGTLMYHIKKLTRFKSEIESILDMAIGLKLTLRNIMKSDITQCSILKQRKKVVTLYDKVKCPTELNNLKEIKMLRPCEPDFVLLEEVLEKRFLHLNRYEHLLSVMRRRMTVNKYLHKDISEALPEDFQYCLKLASIATAQKDYVFCDELLQKVRPIAYRSSVICHCDFTYLIEYTLFWIRDKTTNVWYQKLASAGKCLNSMSIIDILQQFTLCLKFIEIELERSIVMAPLHLEAFKTVGKPQSKRDLSEGKELVEDLMSLHPITYMYFLQYKNSQIMEKKCDMCVALEKLENMNLVSLREGIYSHPDIIINLLGHIYITKGWYRLAIQCFKRSLELLPDYNSAKWHIMFLLFGCPKQAKKRRFKKKKAMARVWRDGQKKKVYIYRLLTTGSIEEKIYQRQICKQGLSGAIMDVKDSKDVQFSKEDLRDLFTINVTTDCDTHDLLNCDCSPAADDTGDRGPAKQTVSRQCQLGTNIHTKQKNKRNLGMKELMDWKHHPGPVVMEHPEWYLQESTDSISYVFHSEVKMDVPTS